MELVLDINVFADAVKWSTRSVAARPAVPVLAGVRIEATEAGVEFSSYDYDVSSRVTVEALEVTEPGVAIVAGKMLLDTSLVIKKKSQKVVLKTEGNYLHITCGTFKQHLLVMPSEEYPELPKFPAIAGKVDAIEFSHSLSQVSVAAARDETLPLLTGVSLEIRPDKLYMLATDRYRMAFKEIDWKSSVPQINQDLIIKAKNLSEAANNITSIGEIEIAVNTDGTPAALLGLAAGGRMYTSQITDGNYPDVRRLFPEPISVTAVVNVEETIEAVQRVGIVSQSMSNKQIQLRFSQNTLELNAGSGGDNSSTDTISATLNGPDIEIYFNSSMLIDGLKAVDEPFARLSFKDEGKPVVITGQKEETGDDNLAFRYLIMPIRTSL